MAAPTVYNDVAHDVALEGLGQLFTNKKFWVAQRVPSRNRLLDDIRANGGDVVMLEKQADYLIADPFRRDCPPGSISYEFVEQSIKQGNLQDPSGYTCGPPPGETRAPGAVHRPAKGSRTAYTAEDDRILYKWVRDAEAAGGSTKGNEIYKQLEAKYAHHTWQSWRDRYIKQLQNRPPSAFNIPDNAPPSPPADNPTEQAHSDECTLDQLAGLFSSDDWEELYAFVDIIDGLAGQDSYLTSWAAWAKSQGNQTARQWQQYYEKVVRPQWLRDPPSKREQINLRVDQKHTRSQSTQDELNDQVSQRRPTTSMASKSQKIKVHDQKTSPEVVSEEETVSHPTTRHESPLFVGELCQTAKKRLQKEDVLGAESDQMKLARPAKRPKSTNASPSLKTQDFEQQQPPEISHIISSSAIPTTEPVEDPIQEHVSEDISQSLKTPSPGADRAASGVSSRSESQDLPAIGCVPPTISDNGIQPDHQFSSDTTPQAGRRKTTNFDTQAILSGLSQDTLNRFSQPSLDIQTTEVHNNLHYTSSPPRHPDSDASTTKSLQEFRHSLDVEDARQIQFSARHPTTRSQSLSPSPAPSNWSSSSTDSSDPDVPLEAHELDEFFEEQYADGFDNEFIVTALKRTRLRPTLAIRVLNAWKVGNALPNERGIWSLEDDEAVESGDGVALARLERKHTLDGWGGITERLVFLEAHRSR